MQVSKVVQFNKRTTPGILRHCLYVGLQSRVARQLGVDRSFVCRVMNGEKKSKRVAAALEKEFARIEREIRRASERAA